MVNPELFEPSECDDCFKRDDNCADWALRQLYKYSETGLNTDSPGPFKLDTSAEVDEVILTLNAMRDNCRDREIKERPNTLLLHFHINKLAEPDTTA